MLEDIEYLAPPLNTPKYPSSPWAISKSLIILFAAFSKDSSLLTLYEKAIPVNNLPTNSPYHGNDELCKELSLFFLSKLFMFQISLNLYVESLWIGN